MYNWNYIHKWGVPENWRSNHRDRSMFPSFQSTPWVYTALQVWAPAAFSSEFPFSDSSILLSPNSSLAHHILPYKQTNTLPSIAYRHYTHILTYPLFTTTIPRRTVPCHAGRGPDLNHFAGRFPLWSLEHFSPVNPINSIRSTSQQRDRTENTLNLQLDYIHFCHFKPWNLRKVECHEWIYFYREIIRDYLIRSFLKGLLPTETIVASVVNLAILSLLSSCKYLQFCAIILK